MNKALNFAFALLLLAPASFGGPILWSINLSASDVDSGISSTEATVQGSATYNSTTGGTVNISSAPTTTYSNPTALGLFSATSMVSSSNNNAGAGFCGLPGGCFSGPLTASALATANLATGSVGVYALSDIIDNSVIESQASATAQLNDSLTFNVAGATSSTVTDIGVMFTIDGAAAPGTPLLSGQAGPGVDMLGALTLGATTVQYSYNDEAGSPANGTLTDGGWVSEQVNTQTPDELVFSGIYAITGASAVVPIQLQMICGAENGGTCSYSDTAAVNFNLPQGVSFTSNSGAFLSQAQGTATPEPASWMLVLGGVAILIGRRRTK
jgi:hypothetical protein